MVTLGQRVLEVLRERGWTQSDLAVRLHKSPQYVSLLINDRRPATLRTIKLLADALGVPEALLTTGVDPNAIKRRNIRHARFGPVGPDEATRLPLLSDEFALWNLGESYQANLKTDVAISPPATVLEPIPVRLLGMELNSPFGAAASVLTCTSGRVRFLAHTGADFITFKTVRSRPFRAHPAPNVFSCAPLSAALDPGKPTPAVKVDVVGAFDPTHGLVNRFGMPSAAPEVWQADYIAARRHLLPGQLLALSIVGTPELGEGNTSLVSDFCRVAELARDASPQAIELNLSCPNASSTSDNVYQDPPLVAQICRAVRKVVRDLPLLIKIGFLRGRTLEGVVTAAAPHVNGVVAINHVPVESVIEGQAEVEPAFGRRLRAGLSGPPIYRYGLRTVQELVRLRERDRLDLDVVAVGGVSSPADVTTYLNAGADAVQAATAFLTDPFFGIRVRHALIAARRVDERVADSQRWAAIANIASACEILAGELDPQERTRCAVQVLLEWQDATADKRQRRTSRSAPVPSVAEFKNRIRDAVRHRSRHTAVERVQAS